MGFGYGYATRNSGIRFINSYEQALEQYETTVPIRGRGDVRPLGHRRSVDSYKIDKLENGDIRCLLVTRPMVIFHPDNTVSVYQGWVGTGACAFIGEVLRGVGARVFDGRIVLCIRDKEFRLDPKEPFKLRRNESGYWEAAEIPKAYTYHIRRKEYKQVKQRYAEIRDYVIGMAKLRENGEVTYEEKVELFGEVDYKYEEDGTTYKRLNLPRVSVTSPECINLMVKWFNEGEQYKAFVFTYTFTGMWRIRSKDIADMLDSFILAKHRDEVIKKVELPDGMVRKNKYSYLF